MASSGLYTFGVDTEQIDFHTEAFERVGRDASTITANDLESSRRSLALMFMDWANKGPNLWTVDQQTINLLDDETTTSYDLPVSTIYVFPYQVFTRQTFNSIQTDLVISPISRQEYTTLVNKLQTGPRPTQYYLQRTITPAMFFWPLLESGGTCQVLYQRMRAIQDPGDFTATPDAPQRWADAIAAGLAARLAGKPALRGPNFGPDDMQRVQRDADAAFNAATTEDRERVPVRFQPNVGYTTGGW